MFDKLGDTIKTNTSKAKTRVGVSFTTEEKQLVASMASQHHCSEAALLRALVTEYSQSPQWRRIAKRLKEQKQKQIVGQDEQGQGYDGVPDPRPIPQTLTTPIALGG